MCVCVDDVSVVAVQRRCRQPIDVLVCCSIFGETPRVAQLAFRWIRGASVRPAATPRNLRCCLSLSAARRRKSADTTALADIFEDPRCECPKVATESQPQFKKWVARLALVGCRNLDMVLLALLRGAAAIASLALIADKVMRGPAYVTTWSTAERLTKAGGRFSDSSLSLPPFGPGRLGSPQKAVGSLLGKPPSQQRRATLQVATCRLGPMVV